MLQLHREQTSPIGCYEAVDIRNEERCDGVMKRLELTTVGRRLETSDVQRNF